MLNSQTNLSLLNRLRTHPGDEQSWSDFVQLYRPRIRKWCAGWGLQPQDADDVTQVVMLAIVKQIEEFEYDPNGSFRSWLKTIAWRAWADLLRKSEKNPAKPGSELNLAQAELAESRDDFLAKMEEESERLLLDEAILLVRQRIQRQTWLAFERTTLEGVPGPEAAKQLNMTIASIYKAKQRVQEMLKQEIRKLDQNFFTVTENSRPVSDDVAN